MLSELARMGARLIIQRAVEEEFDSWPGRARYERRPDGLPGKRNGFRPRRTTWLPQRLASALRCSVPVCLRCSASHAETLPRGRAIDA